jgi:hypothetical protein
VRIGDPVTAIITAYGMPASMTSQEAKYPEKGFLLTLDDGKLIGATVLVSGNRPSEKPVESAGKDLTVAKQSPSHEPGIASPPSGSGKDSRTESGAQIHGQETPKSTAEPATRQTQGAQAPKPTPRMEITLPEGIVEAVLARDVTASTEPISPTNEFPEDTEKIYLVLKSELAKPMSVHASGRR